MNNLTLFVGNLLSFILMIRPASHISVIFRFCIVTKYYGLSQNVDDFLMPFDESKVQMCNNVTSGRYLEIYIDLQLSGRASPFVFLQ